MNKTLSTILGLVLLAAFIAGIVWAATAVFSWFSSLKSEVAIALIAASATIFTSTVAIVLGRYLESKKEREAAHRDKKVVLYDELTSRLFKMFHEGESKDKTKGDFVGFLREVQRKLILWAGPKVVVSYAAWHRVLTSNPGNPKAEALIKMVDFFLSLREDLGLSNKGIQRDHLVRFMLQKPELFMQMYRKNQHVSFSDIIQAEEALKEISQQGATANTDKPSG
jgi:hypothetical protein